MHPSDQTTITRRALLQTSAGILAAAAIGNRSAVLGADDAAKKQPIKRVAAINSVYRYKSHAYHICGRVIHGYTHNGVHHQPPLQLVRMYNDQYPKGDLARSTAKRHNIEIAADVRTALGGDKLDVDAVLVIVEHGDYPTNKLGQILYPRYELSEQVVDHFRRTGRSVPVFVDKHLSYDHRLAAKMVAASRELGFPLMAGSSLPVTWRRPELEPPLETPFTECVVVYGYDRGIDEIYLIHGLETLACMIERRKGGETGVKQVTCLHGDAVWKAGDAGAWSWKLVKTALARSPSLNVGGLRENVTDPLALLIEYRDGAKAALLDFPEQLSDFNFAGRIAGKQEPVSCNFYLPAPPGARFFDPLVANIERMFTTGKPPYPVERTLLTSTELDFALHSLADGGRPIADAALDIRYQPPADSGFFRGRYTDAAE